MVANLLFFFFSGLMLASAMGVIAVRNPVHSVLLLIFAFFNSAALFILLGAEMIAMLIVIVYVGAVAVLFLFVVMMLNINFARMKEGAMRYLPLGILVAVILFVQIYMALKYSMAVLPEDAHYTLKAVYQTSNAHEIGRVLYTDYFLAFQLSGLLLLVAMIGAIVLTFRRRDGVRRQHIGTQLSRDSRRTIEVVKVPTGKGVS